MRKYLYIFLLLLNVGTLFAEEIFLKPDHTTHNYTGTIDYKVNIGKEKLVHKNTIRFSFNQENEADSISNLKFKFISIRNDKQKKDSTTTIDTDKPRYPFAAYLKGILNKETTIRIKNGCVIDSTFNNKEFTSQIFDNTVKLPDSVRMETIEYRIASIYGATMIRSLVESITHVAPNNNVKIGGSWGKSCHYIANLYSNFKFIYTLKKNTDDVYIIDGTADIKNYVDNSFAIDDIKYQLDDLKGQCSAHIEIDKNSGLVKRATYTLSFKGKANALTMSGIVGESRTEDIDATIKQTIAQ